MYTKQDFDTAYKKITRDGTSDLYDALCKSDFFTAPASTRYHDDVEGGLCHHSVSVYHNLDKLNKDYSIGASDETIAILGLLHDICKIGYYTTSMRNVKNEVTGRWEKKPYYTVEDKFPYGHGEKSVYLVNSKLHLTDEEAMAIRWHMGAYSGQQDWTTLSRAYEEYPLTLMLHTADMFATYR